MRALCLYIFTQQLSSQQDYINAVKEFCQTGVDRATAIVLRKVSHQNSGTLCASVLLSIHEAKDPTAELNAAIQRAQPLKLFKTKQQDSDYIRDVLNASYARFDRIVPRNLTDKLQYNPDDTEIKRYESPSVMWASILLV